MILHPSVIALLIGSALTGFLLLSAATYGITVIRKWDMGSGSEEQLGLERRTYLISTMVSYAFGFQLLSLFLFVYTADELCPLFTGAMCAAGTLNVNAYGYPTLLLKITNFFLAAVWLVVNFVDNKAPDYPQIRKKYVLLLLCTPTILAEAALQFLYFLRLNPDVITSCCGSLFSAEAQDAGTAMASISGLPLRYPFFILMGLTLAAALLVFRRKGAGAGFYAVLCAAAFVVSLLAVISVFSLYYYELPTHHCPFCLLKSDYGYAGYPLYIVLFGGTAAGLGTGAIAPFAKSPSLAEIVPLVQRKLALASFIGYAIFTALILVKLMTSSLTLD